MLTCVERAAVILFIFSDFHSALSAQPTCYKRADSLLYALACSFSRRGNTEYRGRTDAPGSRNTDALRASQHLGRRTLLVSNVVLAARSWIP